MTQPAAPAGLLAGALYPFRALGVLNRNRRLWRFIGIPVLVNIAAGLLLYAGLFVALRAWAERLSQDQSSPWLAGLLGAALALALFVGLPLGIGWLLVRFGVVLGSPWYGQLSEQLEWQYGGRRPAEARLTAGGVLYDIGRALSFELKKLLLLVGLGLPLLLLNLVPVAGQVLATVGGVALGVTIACLDFFDSSLERRRLRFRAKLGVIRRHAPASIGFGLVAFGLAAIPLLNLLAIPLCVTAGTLFMIERGALAEIDAAGAPAGGAAPLAEGAGAAEGEEGVAHP